MELKKLHLPQKIMVFIQICSEALKISVLQNDFRPCNCLKVVEKLSLNIYNIHKKSSEHKDVIIIFSEKLI